MHRNFLVFYFNQNSETKDFPELENVKLTNYAITSYLFIQMEQPNIFKSFLLDIWISYISPDYHLGLSPKETNSKGMMGFIFDKWERNAAMEFKKGKEDLI